MPITPTTQENSNNYYDFPVNLSSTNPQLLSVFITELLQQELNTNNPITTQIINDYIDSTSPDAPLSNSTPSNTILSNSTPSNTILSNSTPSNTILSNSTSSSEIYNDSELYDLDSDMPPLIGDHDELFDYDSDSDNDTVVAPLICSNASIP
jgi:hypothetical protein